VCSTPTSRRPTSYVLGLVGPLPLHEESCPCGRLDTLTACRGEGGRVTELVARPVISALPPHLAHIRQPLGGEYSIRREVAEARARGRLRRRDRLLTTSPTRTASMPSRRWDPTQRPPQPADRSEEQSRCLAGSTARTAPGSLCRSPPSPAPALTESTDALEGPDRSRPIGSASQPPSGRGFTGRGVGERPPTPRPRVTDLRDDVRMGCACAGWPGSRSRCC
jgi:hypothetical protein